MYSYVYINSTFSSLTVWNGTCMTVINSRMLWSNRDYKLNDKSYNTKFGRQDMLKRLF